MQANDEEPVDVRARRRLRELRTERGLTLRQVADRANIDLSTLSRLESGKRRLALDHVPALAAALGVSTDELLRPRSATRASAAARGAQGADDVAADPAGAGRRAARVQDRHRPGRDAPPDELPVHDGQRLDLRLPRTLRLILGDQDLAIEPGEAVEFTTLRRTGSAPSTGRSS